MQKTFATIACAMLALAFTNSASATPDMSELGACVAFTKRTHNLTDTAASQVSPGQSFVVGDGTHAPHVLTISRYDDPEGDGPTLMALCRTYLNALPMTVGLRTPTPTPRATGGPIHAVAPAEATTTEIVNIQAPAYPETHLVLSQPTEVRGITPTVSPSDASVAVVETVTVSAPRMPPAPAIEPATASQNASTVLASVMPGVSDESLGEYVMPIVLVILFFASIGLLARNRGYAVLRAKVKEFEDERWGFELTQNTHHHDLAKAQAKRAKAIAWARAMQRERGAALRQLELVTKERDKLRRRLTGIVNSLAKLLALFEKKAPSYMRASKLFQEQIAPGVLAAPPLQLVEAE